MGSYDSVEPSRSSSLQGLLTALELVESKLHNRKVRIAKGHDEYGFYSDLADLLSQDAFLTHTNKNVQLLTAGCIAEILKSTAPYAPFKKLDKLKMVLTFLVDKLQGLGNVHSSQFGKYECMFMNLVESKSFNLISKLIPEDRNEILCRLFERIFEVVSDEQPPELKSRMHDLLYYFLNEEYKISPSVLKILLKNTTDKVKSSNLSAHNLSAELIYKKMKDPTPNMRDSLSLMGTALENLGKSSLIVPIMLDEVLRKLSAEARPTRQVVLTKTIDTNGAALDDVDWIVDAEECEIPENNIRESKKSVRCNICNKTFLTRSNLRRHQLVHSGEKPFQCQICPRSFNQKAHLERHFVMRHLEGKKFSCDLCKKKFYQKSDLNRHKKLHTGEKPFQCSVCGKSFALRGNLSDHKKSHAEGKQYGCGYCTNKYRRLKTLQKHMNVHKPELFGPDPK